MVDVSFRKAEREVISPRVKLWAQRLLEYADVTYVVHYEQPWSIEQGRRYVLMSNHRSYFDVPLILATIPGTVRMIGKQELFKVPIWGQGMIAAEFVPIDRKDAKNSMKSLARAKELMEQGVLIWLAPEGTRSLDGKMLPLRKGGFLLARLTDAVIIPIGVRGTETVMPPSGFKIHSGKHLSVHVGTPIDTTLLNRAEKKELLPRITEDLKKLSGEIA
jgi:1-acyl-sn-glycerol-3-phosphate acyltransferase